MIDHEQLRQVVRLFESLPVTYDRPLAANPRSDAREVTSRFGKNSSVLSKPKAAATSPRPTRMKTGRFKGDFRLLQGLRTGIRADQYAHLVVQVGKRPDRETFVP